MYNTVTKIEELLEKTRLNCVYRENVHRKQFYYYKGFEKYFQIPLIVLSAINSVVSVGLQAYTSQKNVSAINCLLSLVCGIISSIELYLNISETMENEMKMSREFYQLSITIYKYLNLPRDSRSEEEKEFLNKTYSQYAKLCETSALLKQKFQNDHLVNNNAPLTIEDSGSDDSNNSQINLNSLRDDEINKNNNPC
jgi:hypothetical protein